MCIGSWFSAPKKKRKSSTSEEKKRREKPPTESLHGHGAVVADSQDVRRSTEKPRKRKSRDSSHREKEEHRQYHPRASDDLYSSRAHYRTPLQVEVPNMWYRSIDPESVNSSEEMLLNPRPHRSPHHRQNHPKRNSQTTLRGHGKRVKSKKNMRETSGGWSLFAPPPPKTPKKRERRHDYQPLESSPRSQRSHRQHRSSHSHDDGEESPRSDRRQQSSRQRQPSSTRQATPNTAVRRDPDRRFAVLAATNTALEDIRREVFAQPSPPPRRDRLRRYQGVTIPASSVPYSWDCISSSQTSTGHAESSSRHRRRR